MAAGGEPRREQAEANPARRAAAGAAGGFAPPTGLRLAWRPWGGSLVSLMDRSSRPMGIPKEGSAERKSRK